MKAHRYRFSRMLTRPDDGAAMAIVEDYLERYRQEVARHQAAAQALEAEHQDIIDTLRREYKAPRGLTLMVDPAHLAEHGVLFLFSQESEEYDDGRSEGNARAN